MANRPTWTLRILLPFVGLLAGFTGAKLVARDSQATEHAVSFREALKRPNLPENRHLMLNTLETLSPNSAEAIGRIVEENLQSLNYCIYLPVIDAWLDVDPIAARDNVSRWRNETKAARAHGEIVFDDAVAGRFDEARALIATYESSRNWKELAGPYLAGLAERENSMDLMTDFLVESSGQSGLASIAALATTHLGRSDGSEAAQALAEELEERSHDVAAVASLNDVIRQLAGPNPEEAAHWLAAREPHSAAVEARTILIEEWTERDPAAALSWALSQPSEQQPTLIAAALARWLPKDPDGASNWALTHMPESSYSHAIRFIVRQFRQESPEKAASWAALHPEQATRDSLLLSVLRPWWRANAEEADRWLESANLSEASMERFEQKRRKITNYPESKRAESDNPEAEE